MALVPLQYLLYLLPYHIVLNLAKLILNCMLYKTWDEANMQVSLVWVASVMLHAVCHDRHETDFSNRSII